jgi:hypothetical protein
MINATPMVQTVMNILKGILKQKIFERVSKKSQIQGVIESCTDILTTSYWLHVELGKNI